MTFDRGRLFVALYGRERWGYWRVSVNRFGTKRHDGRTRYVWLALGPVDVRWAL
jgi:hypothetical protein